MYIYIYKYMYLYIYICICICVYIYIYYGNSYRFRLPMTKLAMGKLSAHPLVAFLQAACHEGFLGIGHRSLVLHIPVIRCF